MVLRDLVIKNKRKFHDNQLAFHTTFGISLKEYWDLIFGFELFKFDEWLGTPDGISTHDYILTKYGEGALKLVEGLI